MTRHPLGWACQLRGVRVFLENTGRGDVHRWRATGERGTVYGWSFTRRELVSALRFSDVSHVGPSERRAEVSLMWRP